VRSIGLVASAALLVGGGTAMAQDETGASGKPATRAGMQRPAPHAPDEALFVGKCGMCHRQMGMGTAILARRVDPAVAMLEQRTDLTVEYVTQAARQGIGNMPAIQRGEVSDAQLATIARYLAKAKP